MEKKMTIHLLNSIWIRPGKFRNDWFDFILFWLWCWITNVVNSSITKYFKFSILPTKCVKPKYKFNQFPWWIKLLRTKSLLSFDVQYKKLMTHGLMLLFYSFGLLIKSFNGKSPLGVTWFVTDPVVHFLNKRNEMF